MLTGWLSSRPWPIGLDFGASAIRLVRLARSPEGVHVLAAARWPIPATAPAEGPERQALLTEGCLQLLAECGLRGRRGVEVVASLPDRHVRYKSVRMPHMPAPELAAAVEWEAADHFDSDSGPAAVRHVLAGDVRQGDSLRQEVILMAASQSGLDAVMRVLEACRLSVAAIEATPTALARCFGRMHRRASDSRDVRAFLDVGAGGAKVLILRGDRPAFYRRIEPEPAAQAQEQPAGEEPTPAEAPAATAAPSGNAALPTDRLARELALCLRYYAVTFHDKRPEALHLCGGGANDPALPQALGEALSVDVAAAEPLSESEAPALRQRNPAPAHEWAVALGLALRGDGPAGAARRGAA